MTNSVEGSRISLEIQNNELTDCKNSEGTRSFYAIERNGEFFKGYDLVTGKVEFTKDIMEARWFTHTRAAKPRVGERLIQLDLSIPEDSVRLRLR